MNHNESLEIIKLNVARIQDTVKSILLVKKRLQNNSLEAKGEVHCSISRQLEALRSREVWLLDQVDAIHHVKEEILDDQLNNLQHELGVAKALLSAATNVSKNAQFTHQLRATITNLEQLTFEPNEDSDIEFTSDSNQLQDTIHQFGRIQSNKRCIIDNDNVNKKACLSDVREVDHGELYRSLTELKEKKDKCLDGAPGWALQNKEWLIKTPTNTPAEPYSDLLFPPFRRNECLSEWLQTVQEVKEIDNLQCGEEKEEHDDYDYDMADSDVDSFEMIGSSYQETEPPGMVHPYFDQILTSPTMEWLQNPERIRMEHEMGTSYPYAVMKYFRDISTDTRVWLAGYEQRKKLEYYEEKNKEALISCAGQCACTATGPVAQNIEIENLDDLFCIQDPAIKDSEDMIVNEDKDEEIIKDIEKVCRANETCGSFSECICDVQCCGMSESSFKSEYSNPEYKNQWLTSAIDKNASVDSTFSYFQRVRSEKDGYWLLHSTEKPVHSSDINLITHLAMQQDNNSDWLIKQESEKRLLINDDAWLLRHKEDAEDSSETDVWKTIQKHHSNYSNSDWLISTWQTQTSSENTLNLFDSWKTDTEHHSKFTEAEWRLKTPNDQQADPCRQPLENKSCVDSLMSSSKSGADQCIQLKKTAERKVPAWLLYSVPPPNISGITHKLDDIRLTAQSKWLVDNQPAVKGHTSQPYSSSLTSFPCFSEKSSMKTWLKE